MKSLSANGCSAPPASTSASAPPLRLPKNFHASVDELAPAPALGGWGCCYSQEAWNAWTSAAIEVSDLPGHEGRPRTAVPLAFRDDLDVRYIRECHTDDEDGGCFFHAYLFTVPGRLEVMVWIEDDLVHSWMVYRGDAELVEEIGVQLKRFEGHCFTGPAAPDHTMDSVEASNSGPLSFVDEAPR